MTRIGTMKLQNEILGKKETRLLASANSTTVVELIVELLIFSRIIILQLFGISNSMFQKNTLYKYFRQHIQLKHAF